MTINRILGPALFLFCAAAAAYAQTGELSVVVTAPMGNLPTSMPAGPRECGCRCLPQAPCR
jgi:hypothetical protein